jgi:FkbM family methyltransferase
VRDINVKGIRKLSLMLPKWLLPSPKNTPAYILETIHGFKLHINPALDNGVELSLHETGTYEKGILLYLRSILKKGDCFVDVGANIGLMSIFAAECVGREGKILAFEAHPKTAILLQENIELNGLKNIQVCQYALGSTEGKTHIYDNWQVNRGGASLVVKTDASEAYEIDIHSMDQVFPADRIPKAIKIDVEGFELEVLKGATETIRKHHPVLIVELSENRSNVHDSSVELIDFIKSLGNYRIYKLKGGKERKSKLIEITSNDQLPKHDNVICIHP